MDSLALGTSLFISPHFDDVAFSCSGTLLDVVQSGRRALLCTVFSAGSSEPSEFAIKCQTEKGIPSHLDYMAIRRSEDEAFARISGITSPILLGFPEAPNRGYHSSADLFGTVRGEDGETLKDLARCFRKIIRDYRVEDVYVPAANGGHVDHCIVRMAVQLSTSGLDNPPVLFYYEELPYALGRNIRGWKPEPDWVSAPRIIGSLLRTKIHGASCYKSQIPYQFGSLDALGAALAKHAELKAKELGYRVPLEVMWLSPVASNLTSDKLLQKIAERIIRLDKTGRSNIIACEGLDLSGKTTFANNLGRLLEREGQRSVVLHQDDFLKTRVERYARGEWSAEGFFHDFWDYRSLLQDVILPARCGLEVNYSRPRPFFHTDTIKSVTRIHFHPGSVALVEGLFLFRQELEPYFDLRIRLHISREVAIQRALVREVPSLGSSEWVSRHYEEVVFPAHDRYEKEVIPELKAQIIINNNDPFRPVPIKGL